MTNIADIFKTLKPLLIKGTTPKELLHDIEAIAWEYAHQKTPSRRHLLTMKTFWEEPEEFNKHSTAYDKEFMFYYSNALNTLHKLRGLASSFFIYTKHTIKEFCNIFPLYYIIIIIYSRSIIFILIAERSIPHTHTPCYFCL
jgi:hypothetical protein